MGDDATIAGSASDERPGASPSLPELMAQLLHDVLDLLALEGRAAALTLALLVFLSVAGACFALFASFGLSAIAVVALVQAGHSLTIALSMLAAVNAGLALGSGLLVRRLAKSILVGRGREQRHEHAVERG